LTIALFVISSFSLNAQIVLDRQLIGSAALEFSNPDVSFSASVGEPITSTQVNDGFVITQGFQQSNYVLRSPLILTLTSTPAACLGANDGTASIEFLSTELTAPLTYAWNDGSTTPQLVQAEAGTYTLTVTGADGDAVTNVIRVGVVDSVDCTPGFYSGITPNGDGFNDYWHVDNADFFQEKEVEVFNRYGARVWRSEAYDNTTDSFRGLHQNGNNLPDGTYFYVARFDGSRYDGWIEVSR
jgi:gliding motility-associated-like protein